MRINFQNVDRCSPVGYTGRHISSLPAPKQNSIPASDGLLYYGNEFKPDLHPLSYIKKYINLPTVQNSIELNPNISFILKYHGLKPEIFEENIDDRLTNHLLATYLYAKEIAEHIALYPKSKEILYKAALLHDIGKAYIPAEIIQKPGKLTEQERKLADLHSRIGYEILKTTDVDEDIMEAIRTHHTPIYEKSGNTIAQILSVADVFSALKEKRAYKDVMTNQEAFKFMAQNFNISKGYTDILQRIHNAN